MLAEILPDYRPTCLCIGTAAPQLGTHHNLTVATSTLLDMLPLLEEASARYDLITVNFGELRGNGNTDSALALLRRFQDAILSPCGIAVAFIAPEDGLAADGITSREQKCFGAVRYDGAVVALLSHKAKPRAHASSVPILCAEDARGIRMHYPGEIVDRTNATRDTIERHAAVLREHEIRTLGKCTDGATYDIGESVLRPGELSFQFNLNLHKRFQTYSNKIPLLEKHWVQLHSHRSIETIMQRPDDRAMLRQVVDGGRWRIEPRAAEMIRDAFAAHAGRTAPLAEQSPMQRLAWLDECKEVTRLTAAERPSPMPDVAARFLQNKTYPIRTVLVDTSADTTRPGADGEREQIRIMGREMQVAVADDQGLEVWFGTATHQNGWDVFLQIFHPPTVPDLAMLHPHRLKQARHWLTEFEARLNAK